MHELQILTRRRFLRSTAVASAAAGVGGTLGRLAKAEPGEARRTGLKIGIRAASMKMVGDFDVIKTAAGIPGIRGVELQAAHGTPNLRDPDAVRRYRQEARRWGIEIPSLAGVWDRGVHINSPGAADSLLKSIRAAESLSAGVILLAFFRRHAPDMAREESYGPVVDLLLATAERASRAGVVMGLENSLGPADNKRLVDLVDHPAVRVYYDPHNMAHYGHADQAISGIKLLGRERICMVHVKNGEKLIEEPGPIDWPAAFRAFGDVEYDGWYIYETAHASTEDCIRDTRKDNAFLQQHVPTPAG